MELTVITLLCLILLGGKIAFYHLRRRFKEQQTIHRRVVEPPPTLYSGKLYISTEEPSHIVVRRIREALSLKQLEASNTSEYSVTILRQPMTERELQETIQQLEQIAGVVVVQTHNIRPKFERNQFARRVPIERTV